MAKLLETILRFNSRDVDLLRPMVVPLTSWFPNISLCTSSITMKPDKSGDQGKSDGSAPKAKPANKSNGKTNATKSEKKKNGQTSQAPPPPSKPVGKFVPKQFDYKLESFYDILSEVDSLRLPQPSNKQPMILKK